MILKEFPDLGWLKKQADESFANRKHWQGMTLPNQGWPTVILNVESSNIYRDNIRGPLSLFTNFTGKSAIKVGSKNTIIPEGYFYITNQDQHYTLEIDKREEAETFNIHFGEQFVNDVFGSISSPINKILDEGCQSHEVHPSFFNRLCYRDEQINVLLQQLQQATNVMQYEDILGTLLSHLYKEDRSVIKQAKDIPVTKSSTREEIIKRLLLAVDYIYTFYSMPISIDDVAGVSCLSKFHFIRLFKIIYNQSPYQFINDVRVRKARELLIHSHLSVREVGTSVGFTDASTFSKMFYKKLGAYPSQFRG